MSAAGNQCQPSSEHTPTPWKLHDRWLFSSTGPLAIASGYQDWVTAPGGSRYEEWLANAAIIVEAVNSHAALVKALHEIGSEVYTDGTPTKSGRTALAALSLLSMTTRLSHRSAKT